MRARGYHVVKFGLCTDIKNYEQLCRIGYDYIELAGTEVMSITNAALLQLSRKIYASGVPCIGFNSYCNASLPIVGNGYDRRATKAYAEKICERATLLGAKSLGIGSPLARKLPKGYDPQRAHEQAEEFLRITAEAARPFGISILFESLCTKLCDYMVHTQEALEMVKRLQMDIENLALVLDFYQMSMMGEDIADIAYVMPYVHHLHINGFDEEGNRTYLFENQLDYFTLAISSAKKCGYDATISVEASTNNFQEDAVRSLHILRYCNNMKVQ
jgi:sugar phosphate isomerase/epimerase